MPPTMECLNCRAATKSAKLLSKGKSPTHDKMEILKMLGLTVARSIELNPEEERKRRGRVVDYWDWITAAE